MEFLKRTFNSLVQILRSAMARPYLDTAASYVEMQLDRLGLGDFEVDIDEAGGMVHYMLTRGDIKYTVTLSVGGAKARAEQELARVARGFSGSPAASRDVYIDLSEMVSFAPGNLLPRHLIDLKLKPLEAAE